MPRLIATAAIRGAHTFVEEAERRLTEALEDKGEDQKVEFPDTAFYFPMANALLGAEVKTLGDAKKVLEFAESLLPEVPSERLWLPYLGPTLDAGIATLLSQEIITGVRYLYGEEPQPDCEGFFTDTWQRKLGIQLVDGRMPGFAAILGAAPDVETAVYIVRELQKRNLLIFVGSSVDGRSIIDQLKEADVEMSWDTYIVPYGRDTTTAIYPLNWAIRAAMIFGGIKPGNGRECLLYTKERVFAFGLTLGEVDDLKYATGAGAINMGFPIIADTPIPEIRPSGICTYEHVVHELDYKKLVPRCVEVRGVKVKVTELDIPVPYSAAFEGETVRREQMYVEFGGKYSTAFEYLRMREMDEIEDGKIEIIGPDVDTVEEGGAMPLGILVEVAGRRMQKDFESIMERQIHTYLNEAMGIFHMGQRNLIWMRISKEAYHKGFRLRHFGIILHARFHEVYGQILDKVAITIYTDEEAMQDVLQEAIRVYNERDERILGMTDEEVDTFYSCTLCQSYAPNHVCIISPERMGLCGAYSWLDARTNYEINPAGPNQPVPKGRCIDPVKGEWENINRFVYEHSNRSKERVCLYSLMDAPMTSCGCFECILAIIPEANGFMIVNREYPGMTPCGMKFSTLAGSVGGGNETPGFLGVGRLYVVSRKFISADGGLPRLVWMTKELKDFLGDRLRKRCEEIGMPDLVDKIADETVATTSEELLAFLEKVGHPALTMPPLM
ncbi:MAG: CO dehydrogenase/CO-methylating acetyl-CoA synthase complex subunit beta [Candidatus Latescibacterota bacterium]|nr:MAG: CO dehydrogenase/CO-methylating acetyl-CoA synthase complex subunit beta [Candidatus Latescibacterota bacterium]